ncbi:iron chelate uptake ABC transporter family permease subunit [Motilimonas sp. E26]|uniref:FecCD family ABC transporter permease n=1 Tax=Motilimonas sp. E26 TaxID=2865674 RepID=UPI001E29A7A3|nr:iron chelate uptake ABC transporter family permease subunit [Motilimonas sp. E26]MCE0556852.1 iron chelate uptake ABC transporter family permease subunit [Motilimonas sp. E26]
MNSRYFLPTSNVSHVWRLGQFSISYQPLSILVAFVLLLLVAAFAIYAMTLGKLNISLLQVVDAILGVGESGVKERIILNIRLPKVLTAIFVGAALGISGAVFQSVSRNALGSPDVIGFTTGAATGAIAQIVLFEQGALEVALAAIIGGVVTAIIVYLLAVKSGVVGGYRLILTGIGIGSILSALNSLMLVKGNLDSAIMANLWLAGSLHARTWMHVYPVLIGVVLLLPIMMVLKRALAMIEMGDEMATQLGIRVERVRLSMIFFAVVLAAFATGAAGPIAFIALAAPQLVSRLRQSRALSLFSSALMGALLVLAADVLIQWLPFQASVPIGRMTGIVGGIYLIWLLTRSRQF